MIPTNTPPPQLAIAAIDVGVGGPSDLSDLTLKVIVPGILPPSAKPEVSGQNIVFHGQVVLQVKARVKSKGSQDGAGIAEVRFDLDDGGDTLFTQKEHTAGFCLFGGGEPTCNVLVPDKDKYWPGTGTPGGVQPSVPWANKHHPQRRDARRYVEFRLHHPALI